MVRKQLEDFLRDTAWRSLMRREILLIPTCTTLSLTSRARMSAKER